MDDFLNDLSGGFQGAGQGMSLLGGMQAAKIGLASNPWVAGGILAGGIGLGVANAADPAKRRERRLNERLGNQEADNNELDIHQKKIDQALAQQRRESMDRFGAMFSNYMAAMGRARSSGMPGFNADLGGGA